MTLELKILIGFILHLIGDYLLQNDWMAHNKTKEWLPAQAHACIYSYPFLFIVNNDWYWFLIIFMTHVFIDRYRLATYWIKLVNWNWHSKNFGFADDKPQWMSVWLMIIIDNTFHIIFNTTAIVLDHYL